MCGPHISAPGSLPSTECAFPKASLNCEHLALKCPTLIYIYLQRRAKCHCLTEVNGGCGLLVKLLTLVGSKTELGQQIPKCPKQTVCSYPGSDGNSWDIQKRPPGYRTEEKEGHCWTSSGPSGASKEMVWLLLPTFLPVPHPTSILSSFVWRLGTEHGFLIPHLLLPHIFTQEAQGGGRGCNLAWSCCFCLHKDCFSIK